MTTISLTFELLGNDLAYLHKLCLEPLFSGIVCVQQALPYTYPSALLDVLLRASLMLITHMHDGSSLASVRLRAKETIEVLLDLSCNPPHCSLLTWSVFALIALTLHAANRAGHVQQLNSALT